MILKIFRHDIKGLFHKILALVVAGGLCVLPCLYAWFNIYSNWDPYGNTANVPIAVVSEDEGYQKTNGEYGNLGENVLEKLKENDKLGWIFCESKEQAIEGVTSGTYYAAIVLGADFSQCMYQFIDQGLQHPSVTYYQNEKKNAVANKITDTGKSTLQSTINTEFLNTMVCTIFEALQEDSDGEGILSELTQKVETLNENLESYMTLVESLKETNQALASSMNALAALIPQMTQSINHAAANSGKITSGLSHDRETITTKVDKKLTAIGEHITRINSLLLQLVNQQSNPEEMTRILQDISSTCDTIIKTSLPGSSEATNAQLVKSLADNAILLVPVASEWSDAKKQILKAVIEEASAISVRMADEYSEEIANRIVVAEEEIEKVVEDFSQNLSDTADSLGGAGGILYSFRDSILGMNDTMEGSDSLLEAALEKTQDLLSRLDETGNNQTYQRLLSMLHTEPELYGAFLSEPVIVSTNRVWQVENYGSGVTPFYTTLALWVGGILLVSIFKVHVKPEGEFENAKNYELFLGRFLIFALLGQVQAALTVWGNLHLLKVQCLYPGYLYLTAAITSFVFVLLIYTLTNAWGDIGKALVVVIVVMQIAGSSGTYPIEILPSFYQKLYVYFPFPYAINAMRECIAGMYENTLWIRLGQLSIFAGVALLLGLLVRIPFMKVNEFVEERMKDTKMM